VAQTNFADLEPVAIANGFAPVQGIFFDLGLSSRQLDAEERGFSFRRPDPLDMRFDPSEGTPAAELVNHMDEQALANLIYRLGEEHRSRRIARGIVANRPIDTALQLAEVVRRAAGYRRSRTHPATRTFQALRMGVNREMENLEVALGASLALLEQNGRLVTIAYHSLEDRLIKTFIAAAARLRPIVKRVIKPDQEEIRRNPRSRSARLRVAELV
jgi:16S rRNA (cytosine1402-N4)-methyltransferase